MIMTSHKRYKDMTKMMDQKMDTRQPMIYQIRLEEHIDRQWTDWFEGLDITLQDNGDMLLTGQVVDQAALHGLLKKVRDLGLTLVSVIRVESGRTEGVDAQA